MAAEKKGLSISRDRGAQQKRPACAAGPSWGCNDEPHCGSRPLTSVLFLLVADVIDLRYAKWHGGLLCTVKNALTELTVPGAKRILSPKDVGRAAGSLFPVNMAAKGRPSNAART